MEAATNADLTEGTDNNFFVRFGVVVAYADTAKPTAPGISRGEVMLTVQVRS